MTHPSLPPHLQEYRLSPEEKLEIRSCVLSFCAQHPVRTRSGFPRFLAGLRLAPLLTGITLLTTTSLGALAYAAEDTVPGDNLYAFKVGINEPVIGMFYANAEGQDKWQLRRMERRLLEAERMAMLNTGDDPKKTELIAQHITDQERIAQRLMDRARDFSDPKEAEEYRQELEDMLTTHSALLTAVAMRDANDDTGLVAFADAVDTAREQTEAMQKQVVALQAPLQQAMHLREDVRLMRQNIDTLRSMARTADEADDSREDIRQMQRELDAVQGALETGRLTQAEDLIRTGRQRVRDMKTELAMETTPPSSGEGDAATDAPAAGMMMLTTMADVSSSSSSELSSVSLAGSGSSTSSSASSGSTAILETPSL